jgi:divalent metal cation (Fe/Co/Zn/Cd) transporter
VGWIYGELVLIAIAAMLSPTTLTFSILTLVLGKRPLRTGGWFYLGAITATLAIGAVGLVVLGDAAASHHSSTPKTWVAIVDLVAGVVLIAWVLRALRRPPKPERAASMVAQISKVADSPAIAVAGAGAALANPGGFIPLALKSISETNPSTAQAIADWVFFAFVSLLPLAAALVSLLVAREWTEGVLQRARGWLDRHARTVAAAIFVLLAAGLIRNGIAGLTS